MTASLGNDLIQFANGQAGGSELVTRLHPRAAITLDLQGYGATRPNDGAEVADGRWRLNDTIMLSDNTTSHLRRASTNLSAEDFITGGGKGASDGKGASGDHAATQDRCSPTIIATSAIDLSADS